VVDVEAAEEVALVVDVEAAEEVEVVVAVDGERTDFLVLKRFLNLENILSPPPAVVEGALTAGVAIEVGIEVETEMLSSSEIIDSIRF
jgi:hypothetical protein